MVKCLWGSLGGEEWVEEGIDSERRRIERE